MIIEKIEERLSAVLKDLSYKIDNKVILSNRKDLCDYQYDGSFKAAKVLHKSPFEIATNIVNKWEELYPSDLMLKKIEVVNGFINFTLSDEEINKNLNIIKSSKKYGIKTIPNDTYIIDYGGPNVAKPLHVGHLRSAIVGESIKRIIAYMGGKVIGDVHLGDYGLQIGQVIYGLMEENINEDEITIEQLEKIYPRISALCKEDESIRDICASITKELQDGVEKYQTYWKKILEVSGNDILRIYNYLDVHFDLWYGESDAYKYIPNVTKELEEKNLLKTSDGAKIIEVNKETDEKELPPLIYQKSNGAYLYGTTDLATIYQRINDYQPKYIIYITDNRQSLHFKQLFRVAEQLGYTNNTSFEHLPFGTVNGIDGKPFKTRNGKAPKLDELFQDTKQAFLNSNLKNENMKEEDLDILANAIIKFADLQNNREKDYIFDIQKFSTVIGKTGPYILYTYLRIDSILKKEEIKGTNLNNIIYNEKDRELRMKILELNSVMEYTFSERLPSVLANYLYELCVSMNAFYENNHINNLEDKIKKENWLIILTVANHILKDMLELLSIKIPEKM